MKTITKYVTVIWLMMESVSGFGQASLGVTAGVGTGSVRVRDIDNRFLDIIEGNNIAGFEAGVYVKVPAGPFYVRPQLLYSRAKGVVEYEEPDGTTGTSDFVINRIQVPLGVGLRLLGPIGVEGSVVYNRVLNATDTYGASNVYLSTSGFGYRIGPVIDFEPLLLHLTYEGATYTSSAERTAFAEPYRLVFGLGLTF